MKMIISLKYLFIILLLTFSYISHAGKLDNGCANELPPEQQRTDLIKMNTVGIGIVTVWGVTQWDYFTNSPKSRSEGWFQNDTKNGGADKLGHLYTAYVTGHGLSRLFESWCFNKNDAAKYGALSSFAILSYMELGDSFSDFGFSKEDFISNTVGALLGYYLYNNPEISNIIDLRWEYGTDPGDSDFTTDYENSRYLLALKLNGFEFARNNFLKHFEIHLGYYTRGFSDRAAIKERNLYTGIGINLTDLFRRHHYTKTATFLKYFQLPGTSIRSDRDLNK